MSAGRASSTTLGAWLRRQREDRGWTRSDMARQLIRAARAKGDSSVPGIDNISHNIYRWERGAVAPAERYQLYYAGAFGIPFSQFGVSPDMAGTGPPAAATAAYRETSPSPAGAAAIRREVLMAAHEGSEHAERAEQRGIGEATLEQFRADVVSLSAQYLTGETFELFLAMRRVRNRIAEALGRRQWPRDAAELYLLAGCLSALMAAAATNLGYPEAAEELIRSGSAYATIIGHRPLMARLRLCAAYAAYWGGRPRQSAELARVGLQFLAGGPVPGGPLPGGPLPGGPLPGGPLPGGLVPGGQSAAQLHLFAGLAAVRLGDAEGGAQAIAAANDARERDHRERGDELLEIGGEFGFSRATQLYYTGFILSESGHHDAARELAGAVAQYEAGPGPGEQHSRKCEMLARTELALARLRAGAVDAASEALIPVLALAPAARTAVQGRRLAVIGAELAHPIYRGSAPARDLSEALTCFARDLPGRLPAQAGVGEG
jgi:transcriptional regulator with XRE-family HTH domain